MSEQLSLFSEPDDKPEENPVRDRWDKRLANFEDWLRSLSRAERTIGGYTTDVEQLLDYLEANDRLGEAIGADDLVAFLAEQQRQGAKSNTLDRKRSAFKAFFGYLVRFNQIREDPSRKLGVPVDDYELPPTLTESEVERLLEAAGDHPRDLAILRLFVDCGLRVSELCGLELKDIDLEEATLYVKGRFVPLPPEARDALEAWLDHVEGDEVFPITPRGVRQRLEKYAGIAGIQKNVQPSLLRHTFGVQSLARGLDYEAVKQILGHQIDDVMQQYAKRARQLQTLRSVRRSSRRRARDPD